MCKAFSLLITKSKNVYWKAGVDSHSDIHALYKKKDKELNDDKLPPDNTFARVEIIPDDGNYLNIDKDHKWTLRVDEEIQPKWWSKSYEKPCYEAFELWKAKVYSQIRLEEINNPIHPFKLTPPKISQRHIKLLKELASVRDSVGDSVGASVRDSVWDSVWDSVGDSVGASVRDSVWASVRDSVGDSVGASVWASVWASVGDSVGDSVGASVWASVGAYISYQFPKIKNWEYINKKKAPFNKIKGNPFRSAIQLWRVGLVPSYDFYNKVWRLHGGPKAEILFEIKKSKLEKL